MSLKGIVISMASSNARKRAARDYQRQFPGTPYPVALRAVSRGDDRLRVVVGEATGRPHWVDIEEATFGGYGPHMAVIGSSHAGRSKVVELVSHSLASRPPHRGVEVLTVQREFAPINTLIDQRIETLRRYQAKDFSELRRRLTDAERSLSDIVKAAVVVIDGDSLADDVASSASTHKGSASRSVSNGSVSALDRILRCGRSLDVHTVLNVGQIHDLAPAVALEHCSSVVEVHDDGARATLRGIDRPDGVELVLPAQGTGGTPS